MADEIRTVLRCEQCNKPFDKESTLKRHRYYCRSRRHGKSIRARSCKSCAKAKTHCDNRRPKCSRCVVKAFECEYPAATTTRPRASRGENASVDIQEFDTPKNKNLLETNSDINQLTYAGSNTLVPDFGGTNEDLDLDLSDLDFTAMLGQTYVPPELGLSILPAKPSKDFVLQLQQPISAPNVRTLIQRPTAQSGAETIAYLMRHTLKSYPLMMLHQNALPPFIHPFFTSSNSAHPDMEPLTNCILLVNMINSGHPGSRKLFWRNVRLECERLCEDYLALNKWELLAAIQALSIYILIRLNEGETEYNNFEHLLLAAVTVVSKQLNRDDVAGNAGSTAANGDLASNWKDWIFQESLRRICVVYRVVNMLVYFEPAAMCNLPNDLVIAPLPARKLLWEASDEFAWSAEVQREPGMPTDFGLAEMGELVKADKGQLYCSDETIVREPLEAKYPSRRAADWEEWCAGMDSFGGLVMLAASLH